VHHLWLVCFEVGAAAVMSCGVNIIRQEERRDKRERRGRGAVCLTHYSSNRLNIPSKLGYIVVCFMAQCDELFPTFHRNLLLPTSEMLGLLRWSRNFPSAVIPGRYRMSPLSCTPEVLLWWFVTTDAGFPCDEASLLRDTLKGTVCVLPLSCHRTLSWARWILSTSKIFAVKSGIN
jgi:hypothetical protein